MPIFNLKQKIMIIIAIIGAILIAIFQFGLSGKPGSIQTKNEQIASSDPDIISTKPAVSDQAVILPTQAVEISFNLPLENIGEFKYKLEPSAPHKIELSSDRKTIKIIPSPTFDLGKGYTLTIYPETKFDGSKKLNKDFLFHFKTIEYNGV